MIAFRERTHVALFGGGARTRAIAAELLADVIDDPVLSYHEERAAALRALGDGAPNRWSLALDVRVAPDERLRALLASVASLVSLRAESFDGDPGDLEAGVAWFGVRAERAPLVADDPVVGVWMVDDGRVAQRGAGSIEVHSYGSGYGGFAAAARGLMDGLDRRGWDVRWVPYLDAEGPASIGDETRARLERRRGPSRAAHPTIYFREVSDLQARPLLAPWARAFPNRPTAVMTMFETDAIPSRWVTPLQRVERVWVPCTHGVRAFSESGVDAAKIDLVPLAIDVDALEIEGANLQLPGRRRHTFLSVFNWHLRKGPDVLLRAYAAAFTAHDDVCLVLRIRTHGVSAEEVVARELERLGLRREAMAPLLFVDRLSQAELGALYRSVDAYVLPTRGEGFGLPFLEAMAAGVPVIGPAYAGTADFLDEQRAFVVPHRIRPVSRAAAREVPYFNGQRWAEPDVDALVGALRAVIADPAGAARRAARGAAFARTRFNAVRIGRIAADALTRLEGAGRRHGVAAVTHGFVTIDADLGACDPTGASARDTLAALERAAIRVAVMPSAAPAAASLLRYDDAERIRRATATPRRIDATILRFPAVPSGTAHHGAVVILTDPGCWLTPPAVIELSTAREVWVPSAHAERRLRACGLATPIHVVPPPIDTMWYGPSCGGDDVWPAAALRVLVIGDPRAEVNLAVAVAGCITGLRPQDGATIVLPRDLVRDGAVERLQATAPLLVPAESLAGAAGIQIVQVPPDEDARVRRLASADIVVAPPGTPPRVLLEAVAAGGAVVAAEDDLAYAGIPFDAVYAVSAPEPGGLGFIAGCAFGVRMLAEDAARNELGRRARDFAVSHHGLAFAGEAAGRVLALHAAQRVAAPGSDALSAFVAGTGPAADETRASLERYAMRAANIRTVAVADLRDALLACSSRFAFILGAGVRATPAVDAILVAAIDGHERVAAALPARTAGAEPARLDAEAAVLDAVALERHAIARAFRHEGRAPWTASNDETAVMLDLAVCRPYLASAASVGDVLTAIRAAGLGVAFAVDALVVG